MAVIQLGRTTAATDWFQPDLIPSLPVFFGMLTDHAGTLSVMKAQLPLHCSSEVHGYAVAPMVRKVHSHG